MYLAAKLTGLVTTSKESYGSVALCPNLMERLGVVEYQQCIINGKESRNDISYLIKGEPGEIGMRGNLSFKHKVGDKVHILFFKTNSVYPIKLDLT